MAAIKFEYAMARLETIVAELERGDLPLDDSLKSSRGTESVNPDGLLQRTIRALKAEVPELLVITDVALDLRAKRDKQSGTKKGSEKATA